MQMDRWTIHIQKDRWKVPSTQKRAATPFRGFHVQIMYTAIIIILKAS